MSQWRERLSRAIVVAKAHYAWKKLGITVPEEPDYEYVQPGFFDGDMNMKYTVGTEHVSVTMPVIYLGYSPRQTAYGEVEGPVVMVSRSGHIGEAYGYSIELKLDNGVPRLWLAIDRFFQVRYHSSMWFNLDELPDDLAEIRSRAPEFAPYLPESGKIDIAATMAVLSQRDDPRPFPIVLRK